MPPPDSQRTASSVWQCTNTPPAHRWPRCQGGANTAVSRASRRLHEPRNMASSACSSRRTVLAERTQPQECSVTKVCRQRRVLSNLARMQLTRMQPPSHSAADEVPPVGTRSAHGTAQPMATSIEHMSAGTCTTASSGEKRGAAAPGGAAHTATVAPSRTCSAPDRRCQNSKALASGNARACAASASASGASLG